MTAAVDATGLTPGAISPCVVKRIKDRVPGSPWRHGLTWTMPIEIDRRVILAQTARRGPTHDGATWRPRVDAAHQRVSIALGLADAACARERHYQPLRTVLQTQGLIPTKRGGADRRMQGVRAQMRQDVPALLYHPRALIERVMAAVKRKLSPRAPGRTLRTLYLQALLLALASKLYSL